MYKLCEVCEEIPFGNLPSLPDNFAIFTPEGPKRSIFRCRTQDVKPDEDAKTQIEPLASPGVEFEKDIDAIHASAASCPVCKLLSDALRSVAADHEEAMQDPQFSYYERKGAGGLAHERLRLLIREDGGNGFLVMAKAQKERYWYHVAAVGLCATADDPLADAFTGRPIEEDPGSEAGIATIVRWAETCDRGHEKCKEAAAHDMPFRVLDLGDTMESHVKVIETIGLQEPYVTLSHCWGDSGHFITTRASLTNHQQCIDISDLPKTFQDAIHTTRRLGLRYLWIDSICILQDDLADWERQSARMASVYSNSYLTISADAARDNSAGLFIPHVHTYLSFPYTDSKGTSGTLQCCALPLLKAQWPHGWLEMRDEPLNDRGWALQERSLAPRVLHYASDQMYFECNQSFRSEDGVNVKGRFGQHGIQIQGKQKIGEDAGIQSWSNVLWNYTQRKLSKLDDRLPALSGLARIFQTQLQDEYVAGLWRSHLHGELLWQAVGGVRRSSPAQSYRGPSWSWVNVDGLVGGTGHRAEEWSPVAEILDVHIELKGENPFGEIKDAWLKIRGSKIPLRVSQEPEHDAGQVPHKRVIRVTTEWGDKYGAYTLLDTWDWRDPVEVERFVKLETFVLPIIRYQPERKEEDEDGPGYQGLIIARDEHRPEAYCRLGVLIFDHDITGGADLLADQRFIEEITLV